VSRRLPLLAAVLLLAAPAAADAAKPSGRIGFRLIGAHAVDARQVAVTGREVRIVGRIVPYVPDQRVTVRIWRGRKLIKRVTVRPRPSRTGRTAVFRARLAPLQAGDLSVFAVHERTPEQRRLVKSAVLSVVAPAAAPGTSGLFVGLLQQRLGAVGYAVPRTSVYDAGTERAVLAFRKVNGMPRITTLTPFIVDRLMRGVGGFAVRFPRAGRHVEAHLGQQVLALIEDGRVVRAYHTSSGSPVTPTVLGTFHFYLKTIGTNAKGMVDASYFHGGYAIHGYVEVPTYNASHGCLRVPIPDARAIFDWIRVGDRIDVYY
jgi:peptidoglycan hydrolase-like protein with peptidoglycan-binding domain